MTSQRPRYTKTNGANAPGLTAPPHDTPATDCLDSPPCGHATGGVECLETRRGRDQDRDPQQNDEQRRRSRAAGTKTRRARAGMPVGSQQGSSTWCKSAQAGSNLRADETCGVRERDPEITWNDRVPRQEPPEWNSYEEQTIV